MLAVFCSCGGDVQTQDQPSATAVTSAAAETTALHDTPVTMRESTEEDRSRAKEIMEKFQPIVDELNEKYGLPPEIGVGFTYSDETAGIFVDRFGEMTEDDFRAWLEPQVKESAEKREENKKMYQEQMLALAKQGDLKHAASFLEIEPDLQSYYDELVKEYGENNEE